MSGLVEMVAHPLLLGHRGARSLRSIPENTVESFDQALADGCDGFEFDVRLTSDGEAVVCHDPFCHVPSARDYGVEKRSVEIALASGQQLQWLPRLSGLLTRYHETSFLDIELKVQGLEKEIIALLKRFPLRRGFVVSSFDPETLAVLHSDDATIPIGLICETERQLAQWRKLQIQFVIPHYELLNESLVAEVHQAEKKILVWTVNDQRDMERFANWAVDGIISDETRLLSQTLHAPK